MLTAGDIGLVQSAMTALNMQPALVDRVVQLLTLNSDQLDQGRQQVRRVGPDWFGGAPTAHRIGTNTSMAHQAAEEEFQKLADSLRQYSDAIMKWASEVDGVDADTTSEAKMRADALAEVNATLNDAKREATDEDMGDGTYTEPPAPAETAPTPSEDS